MSAASKSACTREISDAASRAALSPTSASLMARTKTPMALEMALKPSFIVCLFSALGFSATFFPYPTSLADAAATSRAPTRTARCKEGKVRETGRKEAKNKESSPSCQDPQLNLQPLWTRRRSGSLWKRKASAPSFCAISSALTTRKRAAKAPAPQCASGRHPDRLRKRASSVMFAAADQQRLFRGPPAVVSLSSHSMTTPHGRLMLLISRLEGLCALM